MVWLTCLVGPLFGLPWNAKNLSDPGGIFNVGLASLAFLSHVAAAASNEAWFSCLTVVEFHGMAVEHASVLHAAIPIEGRLQR